VATPSGTAVADSFAWVHRLAHACHSPNLVFATENCNWHKDFAPAYTFGAGIGMPDYQRTGCILLWGFNPATSWLAQATAVKAGAETRRQADRGRPAPRRPGRSRRPVAAPASRQRWRVGAGLGPSMLIESGRYDRDFLCAGAMPPSWWPRTMAAR
jgi:hypothetical protein